MKAIQGKLVIILLVIVVLISVALFISIKKAIFFQRESVRYEGNYLSAVKEREVYMDKHGDSIYVLRELRMTYKEFKESKEAQIIGLVDEVNASNRKIKELEHIVTIGMTTEGNVSAPITDVMVDTNNDSIPEHAKSFIYKDDWLLFRGLIPEGDKPLAVSLSYRVKNDLTITLGRDREKNKKGKDVFILWRWTKGWIYTAEIKDKNPNSNITKSLDISFQKGRGEKRKLN